MKLIKSTDREGPICPYCEKEIAEVVVKQFDNKSWFEITERLVYYCPHCRKVLGIGQSAWMP